MRGVVSRRRVRTRKTLGMMVCMHWVWRVGGVGLVRDSRRGSGSRVVELGHMGGYHFLLPSLQDTYSEGKGQEL